MLIWLIGVALFLDCSANCALPYCAANKIFWCSVQELGLPWTEMASTTMRGPRSKLALAVSISTHKRQWRMSFPGYGSTVTSSKATTSSSPCPRQGHRAPSISSTACRTWRHEGNSGGTLHSATALWRLLRAVLDLTCLTQKKRPHKCLPHRIQIETWFE
jgi:hypothetical protein